MSGEADHIGRSSLLIASGTIVSRVLGFVRAIVLAGAIGVFGSVSADAFAIANGLPNAIYAILAGGTLNAVLVPQIVKAASHADGGSAYINKLLTLAMTVIGATTVLATAFGPVLTWVYGGSNARVLPLAIAFAWWCLPQIFFYGLYTLLSEVLNARRSYGPSTWVPVLNNVVTLAGLVAFGLLFGFDPNGARTESDWSFGMIAVLAGTATLGIVAQAVTLFWFWKRTGLRFRLDFKWRGVGLRETTKLAGWSFGMLIVTTLAGIVQTQVQFVASGAGASVAASDAAWLVLMLPHSIIVVSLATVYLTRMSEHAHRGDLHRVSADFASAVRTVLVLLLPAALILIVAANAFGAVFQQGATGAGGVGAVIIAYVVGLPAFSGTFLVIRAFFAVSDTRTPFLLTVVQSGTFVTLSLLCLLLPKESITVGVAVALTIAAHVQFVVGWWLLRRRLGSLSGGQVARTFGRTLLALIPAAGAGVVLLLALGGVSGGFALSGTFQAIITIGCLGLLISAMYFVALWLLRSPELREMLRPVLVRLRRRPAE
ncbi:MAG TPA: murein biosynthesis integral membrane protein MurJ [Candidatus Lumbricidophila sp.]|nr:murein biosynthesis integral membrane protein MurJ [Candidatus Lumbricidophila sp.]